MTPPTHTTQTFSISSLIDVIITQEIKVGWVYMTFIFLNNKWKYRADSLHTLYYINTGGGGGL